MTYQVKFMSKAVEDISRLDKVIAQRILTKIRWLSENFDDLTPRYLPVSGRDYLSSELVAIEWSIR